MSTHKPAAPTRYGKIIRVRDEKLDEYLALHRNVWPEVEAAMGRANLRNFTIFIRRMPDARHYLFMYYEYIGTDHDADSATIAADPITQKWWKLTDPCQEPLPDHAPGEWWSTMTEVCHHL